DSTGAIVTSVIIGTSVHDTGTLSGATASAGGTASYNFFANNVCAGSPSTSQTVTVTNGIVPDSPPVTPSPAGLYSFNATYSGDANNNPAKSICEPLIVQKVTPAITTTIDSSTITVGASVADQASLTGGFPSTGITGSVTYAFFSNGGCFGTPTSSSAVTIGSANSVPPSGSVTPASAGSFTFNATYTGDDSNNRVSSICETLTVNKQTPSVTTSISPSSTITVGASVTDQATLTGGFPSTGVTGSMTFAFFHNGACTGSPALTSMVSVGSANSVPVSSPVIPTSAGSFAFNATYSGDGNNNRFSSTCEPLTVNKQTTIVTTSISPSSIIIVGSSVTDQATLTGGFPSTGVTGSLVYAFFNNGACSGTPTFTSSVTIGVGNAAPASSPITPTTTGSFTFNATYSGDGNNNRVTSTCELLTANKPQPPIITA